MRCSFRRKPAWSEPMAIRMGAPASATTVSVGKPGGRGGRNHHRRTHGSNAVVGPGGGIGAGLPGVRHTPCDEEPGRRLPGSLRCPVAWAAVEAQPLPRVTPYLLRRADSMCARRLSRMFEGGERSPRSRAPLPPARRVPRRGARHARRAGRPHRGRLRRRGRPARPRRRCPRSARCSSRRGAGTSPCSATDRPAGTIRGPTSPPTGAGSASAAGSICPCAPPTTASSCASSSSGDGGCLPTDPLELEALRVAFLRLTPWLGGAPLRVAWADLVRGLVVERVVEPDERPATTEWFDERVTIVRERADDPVARSGRDCGGCAVVSACPEHRKGAHYGRKRDLLPGILHVTPTGLDTWRRCPREWRDHQLFGIPASDTDPGGVHGQQLHDALHMIHVEGSCHDVEHVGDVLVRRGLDHDDRLWGEIERHTTRCPEPDGGGRPRDHPGPVLVAPHRAVHGDRAARRAVGARRPARRARLQERAGVERPRRRRQAGAPAGLDPRSRLPTRAVCGCGSRSSTSRPRWSTTPSRSSPTPTTCSPSKRTSGARSPRSAPRPSSSGVADPDVCRRCRYRSICPDSATPGVPVWPTVDTEDDA